MTKCQVIGLLPAGGKATRISPLPLSKELYPIGFRSLDGKSHIRPKVVSHYLLEKMHLAGIERAYFILKPGKWDIPGYFGDGSILSIHLGYLIMGFTFWGTFYLRPSLSFCKKCNSGFGFS